MKRILFVSVIASALLNCGEVNGPLGVSPTRVDVPAVPGQPQAFTSTEVVQEVPFGPFDVLVPCANGGAGELVRISVTLHTVLHLNFNENRFNLVSQFLRNSVTGEGLTTGDMYIATGPGGQSHSSGSVVNNQVTITNVAAINLIGPGPRNNLLFRAFFQFTRLADGEVTHFVGKVTALCR